MWGMMSQEGTGLLGTNVCVPRSSQARGLQTHEQGVGVPSTGGTHGEV